MNALSAEELLSWVERTSAGWRALLVAHPEVLDFPCDVREGRSARDLVHHIVAVELRYAQRLCGVKESAYEEIPKGAAESLYATHDRAMSMVRDLLARAEMDWEGILEFTTRSAGSFRTTRRTLLVHLLLHSIRHYAQLATVARQGGVQPDWAMDYLFMGAR
ncbi:MAG TPA: DinB family protein [Planctomycetota bacterium]|nr:DinB family protein [Planctomycetota bacterium]